MADIVLPVPGENPNWGTKLNTAILRINQELEALGVRVSVVESGLSSLTLRVTNLEGRITDLEDNLEDLVRDIAADVIASDPTIIDAAENAVDAAVADLNIVQAYPKEDLPFTSLASVPMQWVTQNFRTPYQETYSSEYHGHWVNGVTRQGRAVFEGQNGKIAEEQIPDTIARLSDIPDVPDPGPVDVNVSRFVSSFLPIFAARVATARTAGEPVVVVTTGSSTTMRDNPGYVTSLMEAVQEVWQVSPQPELQASRDAIFTAPTTPGIHFLNAGDGGTGVGNYLTDEECDRIAALNPAMVTHMIGANNYTGQTPPTQVENTLRSRLAYLDSVIPGPCQHVIIQQHAKVDFIPPEYPQSDYTAVLETLASEEPWRVFVDLSKAFELVGVYAGGPDPLDLISTDGTHANPSGYYFIADALASIFTV